MENKNGHGGKRDGAGRKKVDNPKKQRSCNLDDYEAEIYFKNGGAETLRALIRAGLFVKPKV